VVKNKSPRRQVKPKVYDFTALPLTVGSPKLGTPALGQVHRLEASSITIGGRKPGRKSLAKTEREDLKAKLNTWIETRSGRKPSQEQSREYLESVIGRGKGARGIARQVHHERWPRSARSKNSPK
jgi:hypothetical protein